MRNEEWAILPCGPALGDRRSGSRVSGRGRRGLLWQRGYPYRDPLETTHPRPSPSASRPGRRRREGRPSGREWARRGFRRRLGSSSQLIPRDPAGDAGGHAEASSTLLPATRGAGAASSGENVAVRGLSWPSLPEVLDSLGIVVAAAGPVPLYSSPRATCMVRSRAGCSGVRCSSLGAFASVHWRRDFAGGASLPRRIRAGILVLLVSMGGIYLILEASGTHGEISLEDRFPVVSVLSMRALPVLLTRNPCVGSPGAVFVPAPSSCRSPWCCRQ